MSNAENDIARLARHTIAAVSSNSSRELPSNFEPGPGDVICSRGKGAMAHEGNKTFRRIISMHLDAYSKANTKMEKSVIVSAIVDRIRGSSGGFVRKEKGRWVEMGDHFAREKVGQTMRDMLHAKYRSSNISKKSRRKEIQAKQNEEIDDFLATNCPDIAERVRQLSVGAQIDEELQEAFNQANCELLETLKRSHRERTMAAQTAKMDTDSISSPSGTAPNPENLDSSLEPMSLDEAVGEFHLNYQRI